MAIDNLMEVCEFELKGELDPIRGSWWQTLIFWSKGKITQTAFNRLLQTLKEVCVARSIGIPSAEETVKLAEAVDRVLKSLEPFESSVIRFGKLCPPGYRAALRGAPPECLHEAVQRSRAQLERTLQRLREPREWPVLPQ